MFQQASMSMLEMMEPMGNFDHRNGRRREEPQGNFRIENTIIQIYNLVVGSTAEWRLQGKISVNLKVQQQQLLSLNHREKTDWETGMWDTAKEIPFCNTVILGRRGERVQGWENIWNAWKCSKLGKKHNSTDSKSWVNPIKDKHNEIHSRRSPNQTYEM